ncbi:BTB and MATH domain-containing protein 36-like [Orbicella faveolata]|uniref:BTB and MATH domain-containing protein 36-like n=1 Tax=Orbicella faveolata TaxID=48498 RepID=UPI0009E26467|nr:BTB and MATH domain-containing protein 36-like [Orbicella faveolata]
MDKPSSASPDPPDFSEPWKFSDVVLVVEEQRFHVHRSTLAFWSPVFERMFTYDFKEKNSGEIPLPGKKASEINELLQMMYPSLEEKVISSNNCYFLLDLAREYQIDSITRKCEDFLVSAVKTRKENDVLAVLIVGQNYELQTLINSCVYEARRLSLKQLKHHTREIDPDNYLQIAEGIIERLEQQCSEVKASCS